MSKYSNEFKSEVIKFCVEGHRSSYGAARKFGMASSTPFKRMD